jgi:hypothetical protein
MGMSEGAKTVPAAASEWEQEAEKELASIRRNGVPAGLERRDTVRMPAVVREALCEESRKP